MKQIFSILAISATLMSQAMATNLTVHEWGTFTSFMGSDGVLVEGLHHEDEPLPSFVHGLKKEAEREPTPRPTPPPCSPGGPQTKVDCFTLNNLIQTHSELFPEAPISSGVTQKMETPVIYFYGEAGQKVNIEIDFPQGIITQYYPSASYVYPSLREARELKDSKFIFDVTLLNPTTSPSRVTQPNSIWNPARQVPAANTIQAGTNVGDNEKFIFYRGIGNFPSPLLVKTDDNDVLSLKSNTHSKISMAIVLNSNGVRGSYRVIKDFSNKEIRVPDLNKSFDFPVYIKMVKEAIADELVLNGLYKDEALAMVNTWEKSYFHTPGVRVLYIVPDSITEKILPLAVKPLPTELKRVLVGRVEIMTKNEEAAYLKLIETQTTAINKEAVFGRFFEPKLRRLEQIAPENLKTKIRALL